MAAHAEPEGREHLGERAAAPIEHDAGAADGDANAGVAGRRRRRLPVLAHGGQEVVSGAARLIEHFVTALAVIADGRTAHEHAWPRRERCHRRGDERGRLHAALANPAHRIARPALRDVFAGEVDDRVDAGEALRVDLVSLGVPRHFVARARRAANEPSNGVPPPVRDERADERRSDHAARAGDGDEQSEVSGHGSLVTG